MLPLAIVFATAATVLTIYGATLASMAGVWFRSETFAHGVLILPIAAALLIRQRRRLAQSAPAVSWPALILLATCVAGWLLGTLVQANVVSHFAMMAMIPASLLLILGPAAVGAIGFPLLFSMLAVPAGEFLIAPLMDLTANGSVMLLQLTGVPVYQDRWLISIPAGNFQVADACSGVRYLIGAVTTGVLFSYLFFRTWKKRIFFMAFTIILTVMANVFRAYIIILLAHLSDMRLAVGVDHFIYGWFLFSLLLLVVFAVGLRYADGPVSAESAPPRLLSGLRAHGGRHALAAAAGLTVLVAGPLALGRLSGGGAEAGMALPARVAAAQLAGQIPPPAWLRADTGWHMRHLAYEGDTPFEVHLFEGGSVAGGRDLTALHEQLAIEDVTLVADEEATILSPAGPSLKVREMRLQEGKRRLMVGYWFAVGTERTANPVTAKMMEVRTMVEGEHKKPALIAVVLETNGLDQPGASLHAIIAELAAAVSPCPEPALRQSLQCVTFGSASR